MGIYIHEQDVDSRQLLMNFEEQDLSKAKIILVLLYQVHDFSSTIKVQLHLAHYKT